MTSPNLCARRLRFFVETQRAELRFLGGVGVHSSRIIRLQLPGLGAWGQAIQTPRRLQGGETSDLI